MSNNIKPSICEQESIYVPSIEPCDECDRLEAEFEKALEDAQAAALQAQGSADSAEAFAQSAEDAKDGAEDAEADVLAMLEEAREILQQIRGASINRFTKTYTTTADQSVFEFSVIGYEYHPGDYFSVYINGLKCVPTDFIQDETEITLVTPISLAGQTVEIVVDAIDREE